MPPASDLPVRVAVGGAPAGWHDWDGLLARAATSGVAARTRSDEPALCFYTSGTTKDPKAVLHAHAYTFAHRWTGEYWLDLRRTDLHWTTADTGWAKAAYGVLFGPWMNGVATFMYHGRFDPERQLDLLERYEISTFCAPPTEYRMLVTQDLRRRRLPRLRHCTAAGEPLNPEVIHAWQDALRAAGVRRLRTDGEHHPRRQPAVAPAASGLDGKGVPGTRPARHRRRRRRAPGGRGGRPRAPRAPAVALPRVLEEPRGDRRVPSRGVVPDRRSREPRRGRVPVVHRPRGRRHHLGRLPHRSVRGRERAPRAPGGGRVGGDRESRSRPRPGGEGVRGARAGAGAGRGAGARAAGPREASDGALQVPARDRVRRRACRRRRVARSGASSCASASARRRPAAARGRPRCTRPARLRSRAACSSRGREWAAARRRPRRARSPRRRADRRRRAGGHPA